MHEVDNPLSGSGHIPVAALTPKVAPSKYHLSIQVWKLKHSFKLSSLKSSVCLLELMLYDVQCSPFLC